jgi:hypothetical protein
LYSWQTLIIVVSFINGRNNIQFPLSLRVTKICNISLQSLGHAWEFNNKTENCLPCYVNEVYVQDMRRACQFPSSPAAMLIQQVHRTAQYTFLRDFSQILEQVAPLYLTLRLMENLLNGGMELQCLESSCDATVAKCNIRETTCEIDAFV